MKLRTSFVSNSSSSSFIVAIKNGNEVCPTCHRKISLFSEMLERTGYGYSCETEIKRLADVIEEKKRDIEYDSPEDWIEFLKEQLVAIEKYKNEGYEIVAFRLDDHDTVMREQIESEVKLGKIVVIEGNI
jgi:hypothetical protein